MKTSACDRHGIPLSIGRGRRDRGLTLFELLIVLSLLGLGMAAIGNVMRGPERDATAASSAADAVALMRMARAEAAHAGRPVAVLIDTENGAIHLPARQREARLGGGVKLRATLAREATRADLPAIVFFPDGTSTGGRLTLSDDRSATTLLVHWLTGNIAVADGMAGDGG